MAGARQRWLLSGVVVLLLGAGAVWLSPRALLAWHRRLCARDHDAAACRDACSEGALADDGCLAAAEAGTSDDERASFFAEACRGGVLKGCLEGVKRTVHRVTSDLSTAPLVFDPLHAELALRACELGDRSSCTLAANDWLEHDASQWRRAVEQRCRLLPDARQAQICVGDWAEFQARDAKQLAACNAGDAQVCGERASALLELHPQAAVWAFGLECAARGIVRGYVDEECPEPCAWYDGNFVATPLQHCGLARAARVVRRQSRRLPPPLAEAERPELQVKLSEAKVRRGTFGDAEAKLAAAPLMAKLRGCYASGLTRPDSPASRGGLITIRVIVDALGDPEWTASGGSDLPDAGVVRCFLDRLEDVHFATPGDAERLVEARYTLSLSAAAAAKGAPK